jgi:peptidoglycan/xylan/chitin deacetylase (PgdA/CDA1 family)
MKIIVIILMSLLLASCIKEAIVPRSVVITIDDAPNFPENTGKMLDVLKKHNVKATFFCIGSYVDNTTSYLLDRMKNEGHMICNHSYTHPDFQTMEMSEIETELSKTQAIISKYTDVKLFRPPYGSISEEQEAYLFKKGYDCVMWDWDATDWDPEVSVERIKNYYLNKLNNCDIERPVLLFHLTKNSVTCLDWLLTELERRNIKVETLWEE